MSIVADWFLKAIAAGTIDTCVVPIKPRGFAIVIDGRELTRFDLSYMPRVRKCETTVVLGVMAIACETVAEADLLQDKLEDCMITAFRKYSPPFRPYSSGPRFVKRRTKGEGEVF